MMQCGAKSRALLPVNFFCYAKVWTQVNANTDIAVGPNTLFCNLRLVGGCLRRKPPSSATKGARAVAKSGWMDGASAQRVAARIL